MYNFPLLAEFIPTKAADKKYWGNLHDGAKAYAISQAVETANAFIVVICDNTQMAHEIEQQLLFFSPDVSILHFPDWEILPYDRFSPHQDIISDRLRCLYQLSTLKKGVLFVPITTLMQRISPTDFVRQQSLQIKRNDTLRIATLREQLQNANYHYVDTVYEHGEFAVRGSIIDVFPMGNEWPYRFELFDEDVEHIKTFNPETQLTISNIDKVDILPAKEFPLDKNSINIFHENWYSHFEHISIKETHFYRDLEQAISFAGIEFYLPLFFKKTATLFDHLPADTLFISTDNIEANCRHHWQEIQSRYEQYSVDKTHPLLLPNTVFIPENELFEQLKNYPRIILTDKNLNDLGKGFISFNSQSCSILSIDAHANRPYYKLEEHLKAASTPILLCAESLGRKEALLEIFKTINTPIAEIDSWQRFANGKTPLAITVSPIYRGMRLDNIEIIAESQLFGNRVQQRRRRKSNTVDNPDLIIKSLTELKEGSPVVHIDHGIGRYLGLKIIEVEGDANEYLTLKYADDAILYVPVAALHLVSRYSGADNDSAPLHRLGNDQWQKAKRKATEKIHDVAAELLEIYAKRAARKGFSHDAYSTAYQQFAASFPFEETPDQTQAINKVLEDMASAKPMDRLVCGDVGFGKTEVAMRAAFTATYNEKQVAVLVPTTLLAQQHYESFCDRFAEYPVNIEVLSRFKTTKEQNEVIKKLAEGKVDILIGTHKLLQADVKFTELGLVIIDEEHRFGVKQKEAFKSLRAEVDVLALTATPIPRTLNMSMAGMRDLSIIATPPAKRLSIKTFVKVRENRLLKEAILRELLRGGQVYYLHNEVETIENTARELALLVPEARIGVGHGKMRERQLESVMSDFYHKRFNILVATTIIETGIDVPSANTIIIDRADKFGLAQLHQLRGRVGRSHHQAYAYLLVPDAKKLSKDAEKRLEAIEQTTDLGAGFTLATHDLEIRGAGELLGDEQSGQIHTLGFTLYMEMLEKAVKSIQRGEKLSIDEPFQKGIEINLHISAIIPADYLPDVHTRLVMYKSIANCQNDQDLRHLKIEMIDRFGLLPQPINHLFEVTAFKLRAEHLGIEKIDLGPQWGKVIFRSNTTINPMNIVKLVQSSPAMFRMEGSSTLKFKHDSETTEDKIILINDLLKVLEAK